MVLIGCQLNCRFSFCGGRIGFKLVLIYYVVGGRLLVTGVRENCRLPDWLQGGMQAFPDWWQSGMQAFPDWLQGGRQAFPDWWQGGMYDFLIGCRAECRLVLIGCSMEWRLVLIDWIWVAEWISIVRWAGPITKHTERSWKER